MLMAAGLWNSQMILRTEPEGMGARHSGHSGQVKDRLSSRCELRQGRQNTWPRQKTLSYGTRSEGRTIPQDILQGLRSVSNPSRQIEQSRSRYIIVCRLDLQNKAETSSKAKGVFEWFLEWFLARPRTCECSGTCGFTAVGSR